MCCFAGGVDDIRTWSAIPRPCWSNGAYITSAFYKLGTSISPANVEIRSGAHAAGPEALLVYG
jgi:hypothetical protein